MENELLMGMLEWFIFIICGFSIRIIRSKGVCFFVRFHVVAFKIYV